MHYSYTEFPYPECMRGAKGKAITEQELASATILEKKESSSSITFHAIRHGRRVMIEAWPQYTMDEMREFIYDFAKKLHNGSTTEVAR